MNDSWIALLGVTCIVTLVTWLVLGSENGTEIAVAIGIGAGLLLLLAVALGVTITLGHVHGPFSPGDIAAYFFESLTNSLDNHFKNAELWKGLFAGLVLGTCGHLVYPATRAFETKSEE